MKSKEISVNVPINEKFEFPVDNMGEIEALSLDLGLVDYMNSEGTRRMRNWVWQLESSLPNLSIELNNVPPAVTRQLNFIRIHTANNVTVKSVFVPYHCPNCDSDDSTTLIKREQVGSGKEKASNLPKQNCKSCGTEMEVDVEPNDYFAVFK